MTQDELDAIFNDVLKGKAPDGWGGMRHGDIDTLTDGSRLFGRHNNPNGPWEEHRGLGRNA